MYYTREHNNVNMKYVYIDTFPCVVHYYICLGENLNPKQARPNKFISNP